MTAWLDGKPTPDVRLLTIEELLALWHANRQGPLGYMAADEGMRRLEQSLGLKDGQEHA